MVSAMLYGQEAPQESFVGKPDAGSFFFAIGENIISNTLLYLANRYIDKASWAVVTPDSLLDNITGHWGWDGDEYFTNQFGHPYQGSVYHVAARSNGFNFYYAMLFDMFGSVCWELFCETNRPSRNDLISTTLGGAALGEMFHRIYYEISSPLAVLVSPIDALNDVVRHRQPQHTRNIYSLKFSFGLGYSSIGHSTEHERGVGGQNTRRMVSSDIACSVVYGDPFVQNSWIPYTHFDLTLYAGGGYPFWYNLKLLSDAYLFSFSVIDTESAQASTGLSPHYDLFADRQINFFSQAFDWTFKGKKRFHSGTELEFKGHIGWTVFSADTFYVHDDYPGMRQTDNNYGTGVNMKIIMAIQNRLWGKIEIKTYLFEVFNVFQNENNDSLNSSFGFFMADYAFPLGQKILIGTAASLLWQDSRGSRSPDTRKPAVLFDTKLYIAWKMGPG
jgi:hypothetical protein